MQPPSDAQTLFILPPVDAGALRAVGVPLAPEFTGQVSPALQVLPMGWAWALFFGQAAVARCAAIAGCPREAA
eukprot:14159756-Alexandrium_andersonii.AAC.1